jgi:predicted ATP-grasp superfamily ATP-dependent carboligase
VILGSDFKALGVVRSLGRKGIPCIVIDTVPRSAWFSRYVVKRFMWHGPMQGAAFVQFLLTLGKEYQLEQWVLFPQQDEVVELVARHTSDLAVMYQLLTPPWEIVQWAIDKRLTYRMAEELEVPFPKTWYPTSEDDLKTLPIQFPVIIKPAISIRLQYATRLKALPANNAEELLGQYRRATRIIDPEEIMIQEVIPGDGQRQYSLAAYCKNGQVLLSMTATRRRQYPIDYGLSSSLVEAVEVPGLLEPAQKLLSYMGVSGMVEVEFKYDQRDGQHKLLDINTRPWGWHTLCIACGLDLPYLQYQDVLGEPPPVLTPRYGPHWVRLLTDLPAGLAEMRAGQSTPLAYLRSLRGQTVFSVFDWRDPLPTVGDLLSAAFRAARGLKPSGSPPLHSA